MFSKIASFEFRYQVRSPLFWVTVFIFGVLTFGSIASDNVQIGGIAGNVKRNSPFAIGVTLQALSLLAAFIMAAFVSNVVIRDDETGYGQIVHSTPVSRFDYLFGRFTGAFAAGCAAFVSVPLGLLLGSVMPWLDPETLGPFRPGDYIYSYFAVALPTLVVMGAFCFALATITRSMFGSYIGLIAMLMTYFVSASFFRRPEFERIVALLDPFGAGAYTYATKYWTAAERNTRLPEIAGVILWNRVIWFSIGFGFLAAAWFLYRPARRGLKRAGRAGRAGWAGWAGWAGFRRRAVAAATQSATAPHSSRPLPEPRHDGATARTQLLALARFDMKAVFRSPAFFALLGIGFFNSIGGLLFANEDLYGNAFYPVTRVMIQTLNGAFTMIPLIVAIYYAGELVWRGREQRVQELVDATPAPAWTFVLPKVLAMAIIYLTNRNRPVSLSVAPGNVRLQ